MRPPADDRIGIAVVFQGGSKAAGVPHRAVIKDAALRCDVVAQEQAHVLKAEGVQQPPQSIAQPHSTATGVAGVYVFIAGRIVELLRLCIYDHPVCGQFPEVDSGLFDGKLRGLCLRRYVLNQEAGKPSRGRLVDRAHYHSKAVGVLEPAIDPGLGPLRKVFLAQFSYREHHLAGVPADPVPVDVHVREAVIRAQLLELVVDLADGAKIPESQICQGAPVFLQNGLIHPGRPGTRGLQAGVQHPDLFQTIGIARGRDGVFQVLLLPAEFVRLHLELLHHGGVSDPQDEGCGNESSNAPEDRPEPSPDHPEEDQHRRQEGEHCQDVQGRNPGVNVGVAGAPKGPVMGKEQLVGPQPVVPRLDHQEPGYQQGQVQLHRGEAAPPPAEKFPRGQQQIGQDRQNQGDDEGGGQG